jgi:hypothetical protein
MGGVLRGAFTAMSAASAGTLEIAAAATNAERSLFMKALQWTRKKNRSRHKEHRFLMPTSRAIDLTENKQGCCINTAKWLEKRESK